MSGLYFVALVPDEPILGEVRELKQYCRDHFGSGHALRSPAHITLYPPFRANRESLEACAATLTHECQRMDAFEVHLDGFDCFKPRVIFVKPLISKEMVELQACVAHQFNDILKPAKIDRRPFHPHMTIAFRDLTMANFHRAWDHFEKKEYRRSWTASDLCILIHGDEGWSVLRRFPFDRASVEVTG